MHRCKKKKRNESTNKPKPMGFWSSSSTKRTFRKKKPILRNKRNQTTTKVTAKVLEKEEQKTPKLTLPNQTILQNCTYGHLISDKEAKYTMEKRESLLISGVG